MRVQWDHFGDFKEAAFTLGISVQLIFFISIPTFKSRLQPFIHLTFVLFLLLFFLRNL